MMRIISGYNGNEIPIEEVLSQVGRGWSDLVTRLIEDLEKLGWDGTLLQIKEKFGGLRFYVGTASDAIYDRILDVEDESFKVCEVCGQPGNCVNRYGWMKTVCMTHLDS